MKAPIIAIPEGVELPEGDEVELLIRAKVIPAKGEGGVTVQVLEVEGVPLAVEEEPAEEEAAPGDFAARVGAKLGAMEKP